jgi:hypothetical protein
MKNCQQIFNLKGIFLVVVAMIMVVVGMALLIRMFS